MIRTTTPSRVTPVLGQRCIDNRCTRLDFFSSDASEKNDLLEAFDLEADECNVPPSIYDRIGTRLHLTPNHPLHTIKSKIESHFNSEDNHQFHLVDDWSPIVPTHNNFDSLLIEPDHVSRSRSDTYYLNNETVLRTHTSAHQTTLLQQGYNQFLVTGDVYRYEKNKNTVNKK
jgi:phenylalanyl-tRNA synthetase alpha chain